MALPQVQLTTLTKLVDLPISKKKVKIRPFLGAEEKLLLMVKETQDPKEIIDICCQVLDSISFGALNIRKLPTPDIETLFLAARCLSKGETTEVTYICRNLVEDPNNPGEQIRCNTPVPMVISLEDVKLEISPNHTKNVLITGTPYSVNFRYPCMDDTSSIKEGAEDEEVFGTMLNLVESISDINTGTIYEDFTRAELIEFLGKMPFGYLSLIVEHFISSMPKLHKVIHFNCPSCGHKEDIDVKGLVNFF